VTRSGNFEHGARILSEVHTLEECAKQLGIAPARPSSARRRAREAARVRARRVRPHRDDKVLTAWNGLMISAFARGARVLGDPGARRARRARRRVRCGSGCAIPRPASCTAAGATARPGAGQLDDYAYLALGYSISTRPPSIRVARARGGAHRAQNRALLGRRARRLLREPGGDASIAVRMKDASTAPRWPATRSRRGTC
jgi:uncharacterized protein YyaL (SSP411 family)